MDYGMAGPVHPIEARNSQERLLLRTPSLSEEFQRAWVQGILVSTPKDQGRLLLDDGNVIIQLCLSGESRLRQ